MRKTFELECGQEATLRLFKMYAHVNREGRRSLKMDASSLPKGSIDPVSPANADILKNGFEWAILHKLGTFRKAPGREPIGYCLRLDIEGESEVYFGTSLKSEKDQWDGRVGRREAYRELTSYFDKAPVSIVDRNIIVEALQIIPRVSRLII